MTLPFTQVNVFSTHPLKGNPVAVVTQAESLSDDAMQQFARWTNLSETTFILPPTTNKADYRVRIFTPSGELPFAGHPTLGTCHAWLEAGGTPRSDTIIQECKAGLIPVQRTDDQLAFAAPPLIRSGPIAPDLLKRIAHGLNLSVSGIVASSWVDNGPGWMGLLLRSRQEVLALKPAFATMEDLCFGVIGPWDRETDGPGADFELRAFAMNHGANEDPVCGSLNASMAQWLIGQNRAPAHYTVSQGAALGRDGLISIDKHDDGTIWVGGHTHSTLTGTLHL